MISSTSGRQSFITNHRSKRVQTSQRFARVGGRLGHPKSRSMIRSHQSISHSWRSFHCARGRTHVVPRSNVVTGRFHRRSLAAMTVTCTDGDASNMRCYSMPTPVTYTRHSQHFDVRTNRATLIARYPCNTAPSSQQPLFSNVEAYRRGIFATAIVGPSRRDMSTTTAESTVFEPSGDGNLAFTSEVTRNGNISFETGKVGTDLRPNWNIQNLTIFPVSASHPQVASA